MSHGVHSWWEGKWECRSWALRMECCLFFAPWFSALFLVEASRMIYCTIPSPHEAIQHSMRE